MRDGLVLMIQSTWMNAACEVASDYPGVISKLDPRPERAGLTPLSWICECLGYDQKPPKCALLSVGRREPIAGYREIAGLVSLNL